EHEQQRTRDYLIEVKAFDNKTIADKAPVLARSRVTSFLNPVYKQFVLREGHYWIIIRRNYSACTKLAAVFFDRIAGPTEHTDTAPMAFFGHLAYDPPPAPPAPAEGENLPLRAACELWQALDACADNPASAKYQKPYRLLA